METSGRPPFDIRPWGPADRGWIEGLLSERWGSSRIVSLKVVHDALALPALVAWRGEERVGLLTYHVEGPACEIVTLDSLMPRRGVGRGLIERLKGEAHRLDCERIWLLTTNDNLPAMRFYQIGRAACRERV